MIDALDGRAPDQPVTGWKLGIVWWTGRSLCLAGVGGPPRGAFADRLYGVDDVARCARGGAHAAPDPACTCGFWSVVERADLGRVFGRIDAEWADLEVESFGTVVVHELGLRSARQRLLAVALDDRCAICGRPPVRLGADKPGPATARCRLHLPSSRTGWSATTVDAAAALGTEIRFRRRPWRPSGPADAETAAGEPRLVRVAWVTGSLAIAVASVIGGAALVDAGGHPVPPPTVPAPAPPSTWSA